MIECSTKQALLKHKQIKKRQKSSICLQRTKEPGYWDATPEIDKTLKKYGCRIVYQGQSQSCVPQALRAYISPLFYLPFLKAFSVDTFAFGGTNPRSTGSIAPVTPRKINFRRFQYPLEAC